MTVDKVLGIITDDCWTDERKAELAAKVLSETNVGREVFETFFKELSDEAHSELLARACDEEDRE